MTEKFQDKYRIDSARLKNWDYGRNAAYFITICTHNKESFFGIISNKKMILSEIGEIAKKHWFEMSDQFWYVRLDEFVVMPDHIHGIVIIDKNIDGIRSQTHPQSESCRDAINRVSTGFGLEPGYQQQPAVNNKNPGGITGNKNPMLNDNVSRVIRWYKGRVTFESRKIVSEFTWQTRFYDHVIRDSMSFQRIKEYIINNPLNWKDENYFY